MAASLAVVLGAVWFVSTARERKERFAARALDEVRGAAQAGNLLLAASDLSRLLTTYGETAAADQAVILLAQIRLLQDNPSQAATELRQALERGMREQFRAPALGLLGAALENLGNFRDAGEAHERAAQASWYEYLKAHFLNEAGRAFSAAGDTARAVAAYRRVIDEFGDSPGAAEAGVRLAELEAAGREVGS